MGGPEPGRDAGVSSDHRAGLEMSQLQAFLLRDRCLQEFTLYPLQHLPETQEGWSVTQSALGRGTSS